MDCRRIGCLFVLGAIPVLGGGGLVGCTDSAGSVGSGAQPIVDGVETEDYPAVVALVHRGQQQFCTGTLIAPTIVVTAAHCLPPNLAVALQDISVFFGPRIGEAGEFIAVADALAHPDWVLEALPNDIGMIELAEPASALPMLVPSQPFDVSAPVGTQVTVVGYGRTHFQDTSPRLKRLGITVVEDIDESLIYLDGAPSYTCNGDSGGPLFAVEDGIEVLAGIHSRSNCRTYGLDERLDVHLGPFVEPFIAQH